MTDKAEEFVLDSYALLAFLENDTGAERVTELLKQAGSGKCRLFMSGINLGEIAYIVERERGLAKAQETLARIDEMPITVIEADRTTVLAAAHLKAGCPVAYADCFAAATALEKQAILLTGDAEFKLIAERFDLKVEWL